MECGLDDIVEVNTDVEKGGKIMAKKNDTLRQANKSKSDEFYTQYEDIQREVNAYLEYDSDTFRGKNRIITM